MLKTAMNVASNNGLKQYIENWFSLKSMDIHTQIPAKVVSVDYTNKCVNVEPLVKTYVTPTQTVAYPQVINVPYKLMSNATDLGAKITIPVEVGEVGLLQFSERDISAWLVGIGTTVEDPTIKDNLSTGATLYATAFEIGLFNPTTAIPVTWDPDNIVISYGTQIIKVPRDPAGNITINGAQITPTGNVITASGTDLDLFKAQYEAHILQYTAHIHNAAGVATTPPVV